MVYSRCRAQGVMLMVQGAGSKRQASDSGDKYVVFIEVNSGLVL